MTPVMTTFSGSLERVSTVFDVRGLSRRQFNGVAVETCCRKLAERVGGFHMLLADGSLRVFTKLTSGKIRRTTYRPGTYRFEG